MSLNPKRILSGQQKRKAKMVYHRKSRKPTRNHDDDRSCSSNSSHVFNDVNSYYRVPIDDSTVGTQNTYDTGGRPVVETVYNCSETDFSTARSAPVYSSTISSTIGMESLSTTKSTGMRSNMARAGTPPAIIRPPYKLKVEDISVTEKEQGILVARSQPKASSSSFRRMFSCYDSTNHGTDYRVGDNSPYLQSSSDALDVTFEVIEKSICGDETTSSILDQEERWTMFGQSQMANHNEDLIGNVFEGVEKCACTRESQLKRRETTPRPSKINSQQRMRNMANNHIHGAEQQRKPDKDMLDDVFEGIEKASCNRGPSTLHYDYYDRDLPVVYKRDYFDKVFDGFENVACRDDHNNFESTNYNNVQWKKPKSLNEIEWHTMENTIRDQGWLSAVGDNDRCYAGAATSIKDGDSIDDVSPNFEHSIRLEDKNIPHSHHQSWKRDTLDTVFESMETTIACREPPAVEAGCSDLPIDLTGASGLSSQSRRRSLMSEGLSREPEEEEEVRRTEKQQKLSLRKALYSRGSQTRASGGVRGLPKMHVTPGDRLTMNHRRRYTSSSKPWE